MNRITWRLLKLGIVISSVLALVFGWYAFSRAADGASILVVVNDSPANPNKFGRYLGEILRAEGLNSFEIIDVSALNAGILNDHDLTILAETSLSPGQASLLNDYITNNNGRLIAMRPDSQIKGLFGLGAAAGTLNNGYIKIDTTAVLSGTIPGQGLSSETLQIHGTASQYSPSGGTVLAQLYSNASTSTSYPAVIAGSSGRAVAFTYDLAWNVIYTRQGNPANASLDTDGDAVVRTIDLFQDSGGGAPWVNRDRIHIPQADEQQRLLARLVRQLVGEVRPLPQLWYFPGTAKTMLILTADAHGNPTDYYQDEINSLNARGAKATFYLALAGEPFEEQPGSNNDVLDWVAQGHTFGIHPYWYKPDPYPPYNITNLAEGYNAYDLWFGLQYPDTPKSLTVRNHQVHWTGWTDAAEIAEAHGYRLDTNFYHWGAWLQKPDGSWPHGYVTGSGQPMKFMRADGRLINVYQQLTQLVDEQMLRPPDYAFENLSPTQAITVSKQLINASLGGDYAALMTQFHVDYYTGQPAQEWAEGTIDYANSQGVPVWNADQWLTFTETRHDASLSDITWIDASKTLTFTLTATPTAGVNLTVMLPLEYLGNNLQSVSVDSLPATYSVETIKGIDVAFVTVPAGNHTISAAYGPVVGVSVIQTGGTTLVSENGLTDTYQVKLTSVPAAPVRINFITNAQLNALSPITFTNLTWNIPQTVIVSAVDDALSEGLHTSVISHTTTSTDPTYNGLPVNSVNVSITDNDAPGVDITESGGTTNVAENGATDTYQVKLITPPAASVRIDFTTNAQLNALGAITFTTLNWSIPQTVTVSAVDDAVAEGLHSSIISHSVTSADPGYNGAPIASVNVNISDNDTAGVSVAPTSISVAEGGITATYSISLTSQPAAGVQTSFTTNAQLNPISAITFTTSNWNSPQTVTVSAVDDALVEGAHNSVINHTSASADPAYNNVAIVPVTVSIADNDNSPPSGSITTTTTYTDFLQACAVLTGTFPVPLLAGTHVSDLNGGTVTLAAVFADDFSGGTLDPRWQSGNWSGVNSPGLSGGILTLPTGVYARSQSSYNYGVIEAIAEFGSGIDQHIGFADSAFVDTYLIFSTRPFDGNLYARANSGSGEQNTSLGPIPAGLHRYRIEWGPLDAANDRVSFYLDGVFQAEFTVSKVLTGLPLWLTNNGSADLRIDAVQVVPPYVSSGSYTSCVFDAYQLGTGNKWGIISWDAILAATTGLTVEARTSADGSTWSGWTVAPASGSSLVPSDRYAQYRLLLNTTDIQTTTLVNSVTLDLAQPLLAVADTSVIEGNSGPVSAIFTATLSISSSQTITVNYATADNIAVAPADYSATSGTLTFTPGVLTRTIAVPVQGDTLDELDETFVVNLSEPVNATLADNQGQGTILDDDPSPSLSINDVTVTESDIGSVNAGFTVSLTGPSGLTVTVPYSTVNGSATAPADYVAASGTLTFTPGITVQTVTVVVQGDSLDEPNENYFVNLGSPVNAGLADSQGVGTINDNDLPPTLSLNDVTVTEGNVGTVNAVFTATLSTASGLTVTVAYSTTGTTATAGVDYLSQTDTLTFTPGVTAAQFTVTVNGDTLDELDEAFQVDLSGPANATIGDGQGLGTILDDDGPPTVAVADVSVTEGDTGQSSAVFTVTLSTPSGLLATVDYTTADGTAAAPADYMSQTGALTFTPGITSQIIAVTVNGDVVDELDETFVVNLSSPANAAIGDGQGQGTILDDDAAGMNVNPTDVAVTESGATATYAISLTSQPTSSVTMAINPDSQLTVTPAPVVFDETNWDTAQTITVTAVDDAIVEGLHTGSISHTVTSADNNYHNIAVGDVTASITDNDTAGVSVTPASVTVAEGGITDTYTVVLNTQPASVVTVSIATGGQTTAAPSSFVFSALTWNEPQTVTVTAVNDLLAEGTHGDNITHSAASADDNYNGVSISSVAAAITDNDAAEVSVAPALVNVSESGITATYAISLTSEPTAPVTVTVAADGETSVNVTTLVFNQFSWFWPQLVEVTAVDDAVAEGSHTGVISHTAISADSNFDGIAIGRVMASIGDNDTAGVSLTPSLVNVAEGGIVATYAISLTSQPTANVTVTPNPDSQVSVTPGAGLTFTPSNWAVLQVITVTAVDDALVEGNHNGAISHVVSSTDPNYNGLAVGNVTVTIADNDSDSESGGSSQIFLPLILGRVQPAAPDLVVQSINATNSSLQLVIKNQGNAPVTSDFWVDVYLNPQPVPTGVNQVWNDGRSLYGAVWGVKGSALPLAPGAALTLSVGDSYYWPSLSKLPATLGAGIKIYAQVDSANLNTSYGGVLESHEITGQSYNNILGPILPSAGPAGNLPVFQQDEVFSTSAPLSPSRP